MSYFMAGAAAVTVATSYLGSQSSANSAIKQSNTYSRAEGKAVVAERMNATLRNAYSTAFSQMQLGLQKRQLSQRSADISAAGLAARGDADLVAASTGSIGASTNAVVSDINQKVEQAQQQTKDAFENAVEQYNYELDMMVVNTQASAPNVRENKYSGPSTGQMLGGAVLSGLASFASSYAMRKMQLGLGTQGSGGGTL